MPTMSDTHASNQSRNSVMGEHVADHAIRLALVQTASGSASDDTTCVLTAVLQH